MSKLVPSLRFPEFKDSGEWVEKKLGEIVNNFGGTALEKFVSNDGQFKFLSIGNYTTSGKYLDNGQRVVLNNKTKDKVLNKYDLVMVLNDKTAKGDIIGSTILIDADNSYIYNQRSERIICNNEIHPPYLWFYLNSAKFRKTVFGVAQGGTQIYVNFSAVKELFINLASFPEQTKIATFLTSIDNRIEALSEQLELTRDYKKGMMQRIFSQEYRFKDDEGIEYPEWVEKKLGEVAFKKSSNIAANKIEDNFGDYIVYGASGLLKQVDFYEEADDYVSIVKDGAGVGRILYCKGMSSVLGTMDIIKPKPELNVYFLYCILELIDFKKYTTGSTIPHIYFKDYSIEVFGIPCLEEQTKIATLLSSVDNRIEALSEQLEQTKLFKKAMLQRVLV